MRVMSDQPCLPAPAPEIARNERATRVVVLLTAVTMVIEIAAGLWTGSMALLADGWHMASHAGALGLAWVAYWYARTRSQSAHFAFGTGKVHALSGYTSALALGGVALWMAFESIVRLVRAEPVMFDEALPIAAVGLAVNLLSAWLLRGGGPGHHGHGHGHGDTRDHNVRAAYLHVVADALTSVLALCALAGGRAFGWTALDPLMGVVGAGLILYWAVGLARSAARQLLDVVPQTGVASSIRAALEGVDDVRVRDLHVWELGFGHRACIVTVQSGSPREVDFYRQIVLDCARVDHLTVEVARRVGEGPDLAPS